MHAPFTPSSGAPLLGVKGACIVGHGSSDAEAVKNGVLVAARTARQGVAGLIAEEIAAAAGASAEGEEA